MDFGLSIVPLTLTKTMTVSMRLIYFYIYLLKLIKLPLCRCFFFFQRISAQDHSDTWHGFLCLKPFEYLLLVFFKAIYITIHSYDIFSEASIAWLFIPVVWTQSVLMKCKTTEGKKLKLSQYIYKKMSKSKYTKRTATVKILYRSDCGELI